MQKIKQLLAHDSDRDPAHTQDHSAPLDESTSRATSKPVESGPSPSRQVSEPPGPASRQEQHARAADEQTDATHDHMHLQPVIKERVHIHEIEEVTRVKELERHKHSVHYHVQKLSDVQHLEPIHHHSQAPTTEVHVRHSNEAVDLDKFAQLNIDQSKLITAAYQDRAAEEGGVAHENNSTLTMQPVIVREIYHHHHHYPTEPHPSAEQQTVAPSPVHERTTGYDSHLKGESRFSTLHPTNTGLTGGAGASSGDRRGLEERAGDQSSRQI